MYEYETLLKEHMEKDPSCCSNNISDNDLETMLEKLEGEINAEYCNIMSDVSLDEERLEALDMEKTPVNTLRHNTLK